MPWRQDPGEQGKAKWPKAGKEVGAPAADYSLQPPTPKPTNQGQRGTSPPAPRTQEKREVEELFSQPKPALFSLFPSHFSSCPPTLLLLHGKRLSHTLSLNTSHNQRTRAPAPPLPYPPLHSLGPRPHTLKAAALFLFHPPSSPLFHVKQKTCAKHQNQSEPIYNGA